MNKTNRIKTCALLLLCLPFCGGWTSAPNNQTDDDRYVGVELIATYASSETISYVSKQVVEDITTANGTPRYFAVSGMQNGCGAVAGGIIVGFYDKYYGNLIPNWDSYYSTGRYKGQDGTYVQTLLFDLYNRMQTNVVAPGVSQDEFKNGLQSYVVDQGYNLQYTSLGTGNNFNYSTFKTAISNNEATVLFVQPSNLYSLQTVGGEDHLISSNLSGNHVMVAYGYYEVKYTLSNGTRTDKYLYVATGLSGSSTAFYKVGSYVDAAYKVTIN
ncbi:MAG: hypothetical protein K2K13_06560 [Clostridiales bacterium]|nr:hypothetical protein [Clostridiales bacterium]